MTGRPSALLTDLYQINMMQAYLDHGETKTAVFEFFVRSLPARRGFLLAAGLEQALDYLEDLRFSAAEIDWLKSTGRFGRNLLDYLREFRFTGDVHAMPEGTVFFANEPILRITAPLPQAQFAESRLINILHFQTLIAAKAARVVLAAPGKFLVDFGLRRAHGAEAGLMAARASYVAGFAGTATVLAGEDFGIPLYGTMAHSFIEAFDDESAAFAASRSRARTISCCCSTPTIPKRPRGRSWRWRRGSRPPGSPFAAFVSTAAISSRCRAACAASSMPADLRDVTIFASGGLDEDRDRRLCRGSNAPIDGFGVGTSLDDIVGRAGARLRLQVAGICRPAAAQTLGEQGHLAGPQAGVAALRRGRPHGRRPAGARYRPPSPTAAGARRKEAASRCIEPVMQNGRRLRPPPSLDDIRRHAKRELERLPEPLRRLEPGTTYAVEVADELRSLRRRSTAGWK